MMVNKKPKFVASLLNQLLVQNIAISSAQNHYETEKKIITKSFFAFGWPIYLLKGCHVQSTLHWVIQQLHFHRVERVEGGGGAVMNEQKLALDYNT